MKNKKMQPGQIIIILSIIFVLTFTGSAFAHKVIIFAWVEGDYIFSESSFASKRKAKNCPVNVVNEQGKIIQKGLTDEQGRYSFKIPGNINSDLVLNLDAGQGHKAHWKISQDELKKTGSTDEIKTVMEKKEKLEQGPSVYKVIAGIGIIFLFAFILKFIKKPLRPGSNSGCSQKRE